MIHEHDLPDGTYVSRIPIKIFNNVSTVIINMAHFHISILSDNDSGIIVRDSMFHNLRSENEISYKKV